MAKTQRAKPIRVPPNYFRHVHPMITFTILFGLFYCGFFMCYFPEWLIYKSHLGGLGELLHYFATENNEFVRKAFKAIMAVHFSESVFALSWCLSLRLNAEATLKWMLSSFIHGLFALRYQKKIFYYLTFLLITF